MDDVEKIQSVAMKFKACKDLLTAIGDENRLHLMIEMMQMGSCGGARVGDITA